MAKNFSKIVKDTISEANKVHKFLTGSDEVLFNWDKEAYNFIDKTRDLVNMISISGQVALRLMTLNDTIECYRAKLNFDGADNTEAEKVFEKYEKLAGELRAITEEYLTEQEGHRKKLAEFEALVAEVETDKLVELTESYKEDEELVKSIEEDLLGDTLTLGSMIDKEYALNVDRAWRERYPFLTVQHILRQRMTEQNKRRTEELDKAREDYDKF